jgi:hypothetical protein
MWAHGSAFALATFEDGFNPPATGTAVKGQFNSVKYVRDLGQEGDVDELAMF